jgi:hypothetical protein
MNERQLQKNFLHATKVHRRDNGVGKTLWRRRCGLIAASIAASALMIVVRVRHLMLDGPPSRLTQPLARSKTKTKPKIVPLPRVWSTEKENKTVPCPMVRRPSGPAGAVLERPPPPARASAFPRMRRGFGPVGGPRRHRRGRCRARKPLVFRPKSRFQAHKLSRRPLPWDSRPAARPARSSGCLETGKCTEPIFSRWILAGSIFSPTEVGFQRLWPERLSPTRPAQRQTFAGYLGPARDGAPGSGRCYARRT